jgi:hypothetical protein
MDFMDETGVFIRVTHRCFVLRMTPWYSNRVIQRSVRSPPTEGAGAVVRRCHVSPRDQYGGVVRAQARAMLITGQ